MTGVQTCALPIFLLDVAPFIKRGVNRAMMPVRFISEQLGANVYWLPETRQVKVVRDDTEIILTIGFGTALVNGKETVIDCPAEIREGRTFVPLRFISEALGATVNWNSETKTITISLLQ